MASNCDMELCPNWSGDGWSCPCTVLGLERPVFDLDPPEPERCEADYNPDGGYDGVCLARLDRHGNCSRPDGYHDDEAGEWVPSPVEVCGAHPSAPPECVTCRKGTTPFPKRWGGFTPRLSEETSMAETFGDCRTEEGVTTGLIDAIITAARVLARRDLTSVEVREALADLRADEDVAALLASAALRGDQP